MPLFFLFYNSPIGRNSIFISTTKTLLFCPSLRLQKAQNSRHSRFSTTTDKVKGTRKFVPFLLFDGTSQLPNTNDSQVAEVFLMSVTLSYLNDDVKVIFPFSTVAVIFVPMKPIA